MPSGAKKRKQAKKKREQQAHSNTINSSSLSDTHSQGNDDPRSQDERDSDGGELGSPASLDHQNQHHPFNEEPEKSVQSSFVTEDSSFGVEGENVEVSQNTSVVEIQREVSLDKDNESEDVNVEHVELSKASKSSSSSSSDDESRANDEKQEVVGELKEDSTIEKPLSQANGNSVTEIPVVPLSEVAKQATEGAEFDNVEGIDVVESEFKESEDKLLPKSAGQVPEVNEEEVLPVLNHNAEASQTSYAENIKETEDSTVAHSSETGKDKKKARDFEVSENIETKPVVPPAPQITQRTSFLSCCGLFDVLTGSNR